MFSGITFDNADVLGDGSNVNVATRPWAVIWFDSTPLAAAVTAPDTYGVTTDGTWIVPTNPGTYTAGNNFASQAAPGAASAANGGTVIPEPGSLALLGLAVLVCYPPSAVRK